MSINKYNKATDTLSLCAGATRTWVGTQDALAAALAKNEIPANTIIGITDDQVSELAEDIYSTDEVQTNKVWIDGKPIYRKVYTNLNISLASNSWANIMTFPTDVETITDYVTIHNSMAFQNSLLNKSDNYLAILSSQSWRLSELILEYTKTTD